MNDKENCAAMICNLIKNLQTNPDERTLRMLIAALMNTQVWIPMTVSMENADIEQFLGAKAGDTITTSGQIRMKPDMLKNGAGELFFPAFTEKEETPEQYQNSFSWIAMDFMNCVHSAYSNKTCSGVVINGFSNPFVVNRTLMELMRDLEKTENKNSFK